MAIVKLPEDVASAVSAGYIIVSSAHAVVECANAGCAVSSSVVMKYDRRVCAVVSNALGAGATRISVHCALSRGEVSVHDNGAARCRFCSATIMLRPPPRA